MTEKEKSSKKKTTKPQRKPAKPRPITPVGGGLQGGILGGPGNG